MYIVPAFGVAAVIRSWNDLVPVGTPCTVCGVETRTWSPAGRGRRGQPAVFVEAFEPPIPLHLVKVEGIVRVSRQEQRRKAGR